MSRILLTIFTPTYNRCDLLSRLYESIVSSGNCDKVEWLVVDDGSTDETKKVMQDLIEKNTCEISFFSKENGGKPSAFNLGIEKARGEMFVCIDDDDYLTPNAIDDIIKLQSLLIEDDYIVGFVGRCVSPQGKFLGNGVKGDKLLYSDSIEIRDKYKIWGEPEIYRTEVLKHNLFPIIKNEKFITEAIVFDKITHNKKLVYTNVPMMVKEFLPGGLTDKNLLIRINNPKGTLAYYSQRIRLSKTIKGTARSVINYMRFALHAKSKILPPNKKIFALCLFTVALAMYITDKRKLKKKSKIKEK